MTLLVALMGVFLSPGISRTEDKGQLIVADSSAEKLYVYTIPDFHLEATFDNLRAANEPGFLSLQGKRVLFINESGSSGHTHEHDDEGEEEEIEHEEEEEDAENELIMLHMRLQGEPRIIGRAPIGKAEANHLAIHPNHTYAAVGSGNTLTLVDLRWWSATRYESVASLELASEETGVAIGDNPSTVYVRRIATDFSSGALDAYAIKDLLLGKNSPTSEVPLDSSPHGEILTHRFNRFCSATDQGFECAEVIDGSVARSATVPYRLVTDSTQSERAWTAALSQDQRFLYSNIERYPEGDFLWSQVENDAYIADLQTNEVVRLPLGPGWVTLGSYAVAEPHVALYAVTHPTGDTAYLIDANPQSPTFRQLLATIPLAPLRNNPNTPERDPFSPGFQTRRVALTPDGRWGFVSHGGDGFVSVIDTTTKTVVQTLTLPTLLGDEEALFHGGGRLIAVQPGSTLGDTISR